MAFPSETGALLGLEEQRVPCEICSRLIDFDQVVAHQRLCAEQKERKTKLLDAVAIRRAVKEAEEAAANDEEDIDSRSENESERRAGSAFFLTLSFFLVVSVAVADANHSA